MIEEMLPTLASLTEYHRLVGTAIGVFIVSVWIEKPWRRA